jgi:hypothetical protein
MKKIVFMAGVPALIAVVALFVIFGMRESWLVLSVILIALIGFFAVRAGRTRDPRR